jgi:hypothetical protein
LLPHLLLLLLLLLLLPLHTSAFILRLPMCEEGQE